MYYPSFAEFEKHAKDARVVPVSMEIHADMETPISIFKRFYDSENCFLLESVEGGEKWARYSIIGRNPSTVIKSNGEETEISDITGERTTAKGNPIRILQDTINRFKSVYIPGMPRFSGGAVGYFGYDLARYDENLPDVPHDDLGLPDCLIGQSMCYILVYTLNIVLKVSQHKKSKILSNFKHPGVMPIIIQIASGKCLRNG